MLHRGGGRRERDSAADPRGARSRSGAAARRRVGRLGGLQRTVDREQNDVTSIDRFADRVAASRHARAENGQAHRRSVGCQPHLGWAIHDQSRGGRSCGGREQAEALLTSAGCSLSIHIDSLLVGHWDRMRLEQVVTSVLSNALKHGAGKPIEMWLSVVASPRSCK